MNFLWRMGLLTTLLAGSIHAADQATSHPATEPVTLPSSRPAASEPLAPPALAPASQPVDLSTPKATLRLFATALHDGDLAKLRHAVAIDSPAEDQMLAAMAEMAARLAALHDSAVRQFGDSAAARFTGDTAAQFKESLERIEAADVVIEADKANIRYPGAKLAEYELRRIGGRWKIPVAQFSHGADPQVLSRRINESKAQAAVVAELTTEINDGKYKTADAAADAWRGKIMQGIGGPQPKTLPTTVPSDHPQL